MPCTLSNTNMHKNTEQRENKEVSRWMSHPKHRITYTYILLWVKNLLSIFASKPHTLLSQVASVKSTCTSPQLIKITWSLHSSL